MFVLRDTDFFGRLLGPNIQTMIALQDHSTHLARRRPWARGLSNAAVKEYEPLVAARTRLLVEKVGEQEGEVVLDKWFDKFAYVLYRPSMQARQLT